MTSPRPTTHPSSRTPWSTAYKSPDRGVSPLGMRLSGTWMRDVERLQETCLDFFNRRLEKEAKNLSSLAQCRSQDAWFDLAVGAWGDLAADYAELVQGSLC
jgi:hypothetical protein